MAEQRPGDEAPTDAPPPPPQPNVGGPTPDRPPAGPGDPRHGHRLWTGVIIAIAVLLIILGGVLAWPHVSVIGTTAEETAASPPPATPPASTPAPRPGDCREVTKTVQIAGESRTVSGRACMQADGSWRMAD
jgi:hypothetical protein